MLLLRGHTRPVRCLAYSPDGRLLASSSGDGTVRVWDLATARERVSLPNGGYEAPAMAFAPDGRTLASADWDGAVRLWDPATGQPRAKLRHRYHVIGLTYIRDGRMLVTVTRQKVYLWNAAAGKCQTTYRLFYGPYLCRPAVAGDGKLVALTESGGHTTVVWDTSGQNALVRMEARSLTRSLALARDGRTLATATGYAVKLWDPATGRLQATLKGMGRVVHAVAFTPDSRALASGGEDKTVRLWDVAAGRLRAAFDWNLGTVSALAFAPDGTTAAAAGQTADIMVWDVDGG
jgi:WD40 repeat protein